MPHPTSIRIFLADGTADGVRVVEKSNWTGKALMAPRSRYSDLKARAEDLEGVGVYVLIGPAESGSASERIYIGEADGLGRRLDSHQRDKDFRTRLIVFTSKDQNLNKAHARHLEYELISRAQRAQRAEVENGNAGGRPTLSEPEQADAQSFLAEMLLIYPVLGLSAFTPPEERAVDSTERRLYLRGPSALAEGAETADGFVVYEGGLARRTSVESMQSYGEDIRDRLVEQGVLVAQDAHSYRVTRDYVFPSPSQAAMIVLGRNANGRREWKSASGETLRDIQVREAGSPDEGT